MARLRRPVVRVETGIPVELLDPSLALWRDDDKVQEWRKGHGLPVRRWPPPWRHRRRHGSAVDDWAVRNGLVDVDGCADWQRVGPLLRGRRAGLGPTPGTGSGSTRAGGQRVPPQCEVSDQGVGR